MADEEDALKLVIPLKFKARQMEQLYYKDRDDAFRRRLRSLMTVWGCLEVWSFIWADDGEMRPVHAALAVVVAVIVFTLCHRKVEDLGWWALRVLPLVSLFIFITEKNVELMLSLRSMHAPIDECTQRRSTLTGQLHVVAYVFIALLTVPWIIICCVEIVSSLFIVGWMFVLHDNEPQPCIRLQSWAVLVLITCIVAFLNEWDERRSFRQRRRWATREVHLRQLAEAANTAKRTFISYIFHEIRVPFNAMFLGVDSLLQETNRKENRTQFELMSLIKEQGFVIKQLLSDVLDLQKIEEGKFALEMRPLSPRNILNSVKWSYRQVEVDKDVHLNLDVAIDVPARVIGDVNRLRQILVNLISNAFKFTPKGGEIFLSCCICNDGCPGRHLHQPGRSPSINVGRRLKGQAVTALQLTALRPSLNGTDESLPLHPDGKETRSSVSTASAIPDKQRRRSAPAVAVDAASRDNDSIPLPTPPAGPVEAHSGPWLQFMVRDTGVGIALEDQSKLFQDFVQIRPGQLQQGKGTGLGLAISKRLVEMHHGNIGVESVPGYGSTFWFRIPLDETDEAPTGQWDPSTVNRDQKELTAQPSVSALSLHSANSLEDVERSLNGTVSATRAFIGDAEEMVTANAKISPLAVHVTPPAADSAATQNGPAETGAHGRTGLVIKKSKRRARRRKKAKKQSVPAIAPVDEDEVKSVPASKGPTVLVVEDDRTNRRILMHTLRGLGCTVCSTVNGQESVQFVMERAATGNAVDLVFMDGNMPIMSGPEATAQLRSLDVAVPIVAVTGNAMDDDRQQFLDSGASEILIKPITRDILKQTLAKHLPQYSLSEHL